MKRIVLALLLLLISGDAQAQGDERLVPIAGSLEIMAMPIFGPASLAHGGWAELLVRIENRGEALEQGEVIVSGGYGSLDGEETAKSFAPFAVSAGATVSLRIPSRIGMYVEPRVVVWTGADKRYQQSFVRSGDNDTLLVDVARTSVLGTHIDHVSVGSRNDPWGSVMRGSMPSHSATTALVVTPMFDSVTGDTIMPRRAAGYSRIAAVLIRSDELVRLGAAELEALSGFVLGGGTLAVVIARPEDERDPIVISLIGDKAQRTAVDDDTLVRLPPSTAASSSFGIRTIPYVPSIDPKYVEDLGGFRGGNLRPSPYGSSATYGLGEVHLLAFDPHAKPFVDHPWVHLRMLDMLRRANERVTGVLFRHGDPHVAAREVRRELDPNESSRWAIVLSAILLCLYALLAGPANFTFWRRRGRPLRAVLWLPLISLAGFSAVVMVGLSAKGCRGKARHLTVVEAGAGMTSGTARRWRGFFVPTADKLTIRTDSVSSVLGSEQTELHDAMYDPLMVDRHGLRLEELQLRPWETMVIREDSYAKLGGGVAIKRLSNAESQVINRTGRRLLGIVVHQPNVGALFLPSLDDGDSVITTEMRAISRAVTVGSLPPASGALTALSVRDFNMYVVERDLNLAADGLVQAWAAVVDAIGDRKDWFPGDVPVLLAQLEGGEGKSTDSGLRVDSDRVLVRIVGYGGAP